MSWTVHGPLELRGSINYYRGLPNNGFYDAMKEEVLQAYLGGTLSAAIASSRRPSPALPTAVTFILFADWGTEDAEATLHKYFLVPANSVGADLSDVVTCCGSRAGYNDEWLIVRGAGWWSMFDVPPRSATAAVATTAAAAVAVADAVVVTRVGVGVGLVTEEGWKHPEVPGSDCVTYHEGAVWC